MRLWAIAINNRCHLKQCKLFGLNVPHIFNTRRNAERELKGKAEHIVAVSLTLKPGIKPFRQVWVIVSQHFAGKPIPNPSSRRVPLCYRTRAEAVKEAYSGEVVETRYLTVA